MSKLSLKKCTPRVEQMRKAKEEGEKRNYLNLGKRKNMNQRAQQEAANEMIRLAVEMHTDDPQELVRLFSRCARNIRREIEAGTYLRPYPEFVKGRKPE